MTEYMRMSGMYWVMTALDLVGCQDRLPSDDVISTVANCQEESGGFIPSPGHDAHILYTLSAVQVSQGLRAVFISLTYLLVFERCRPIFTYFVFHLTFPMFPQILVMYDAENLINIESLVSYVAGLQQKDGSFIGDKWGEVDTRFSFCAIACLSLVVSDTCIH